MNKLEKSIARLLLGKYPRTHQVMQGALVSGFDRLSGSPVPGPLTATYGVWKSFFAYGLDKNGYSAIPMWQKMSLYAMGVALPYADKIYCALAPSIEALFK